MLCEEAASLYLRTMEGLTIVFSLLRSKWVIRQDDSQQEIGYSCHKPGLLVQEGGRKVTFTGWKFILWFSSIKITLHFHARPLQMSYHVICYLKCTFMASQVYLLTFMYSYIALFRFTYSHMHRSVISCTWSHVYSCYIRCTHDHWLMLFLPFFIMLYWGITDMK